MCRKLLITGGSGFLGAQLTRCAQGAWCTSATYFTHPLDVVACDMLHLDIRDEVAVTRMVSEIRPQVIIHAAADMSSPAAMQQVIVTGTRNIVTAAAAFGARLIHISTDVLFDGQHAPYTEDDLPSPISPYGQAKAEAETIVRGACSAAVIVRTSLIYGFSPPDPRTCWVVDSVRQGVPITLFTDELRCPVWVEQLAEALLELASGDEGGVWNLAGPQALSRYDWGERLARAHGLDPGRITPGCSRTSGLFRPRDCRLDVSKAQNGLNSPLWGVDQVLDYVGLQGTP